MSTQLHELAEAGQSIWLDNIRRSMFASGELHSLIGLGLRGMTSNPTIFEKAIGAGNDYDAQLRELVGKERDPNHVFEALAIDDIRHALDEFRPLYESTNGGDGFVSLEVSPMLAGDSAATVDAAKRLWKMVDRPNLMVKIPATPACIAAITDVIAEGINVNVTLIFSIETYEAAANAYVAGIERRIASGLPVDRIASVASVFVSRIDGAVDKLLESKIAAGQKAEHLLGKAGIANLKMTYQAYEALFGGERFAKCKKHGARVQRPLWASTSTKNPKYPDLMYVESVVGKHTVNTVPPATLDGILEHGRVVADTVEQDLDGARAALAGLEQFQISLYDVTQKLQVEGVASFAESYDKMLAAIEAKLRELAASPAAGPDRVRLAIGTAQAAVDAELRQLSETSFLKKLWAKDPSPWSDDPAHEKIIRNALGWLDFPERVAEGVPELVAFAAESTKLYKHVVVLGMGGSSLAPDTLRATFGKVDGYPELHVLDSSDPDQIAALEQRIDLAHSVFIVASKSGSTIEPEAFYRYFFDRVQKTLGSAHAGAQFVAVTDPETQLARQAKEAGFRRIFLNDPAIGGRYSALSYFGMVPAAMAGYDVKTILDRGIGALLANGRTSDPAQAAGVRFGAALGALANGGRDKLTIVTHPTIAAFGAWCEQLVAESTGKLGKGIVPLENEMLGAPAAYGDDRVFVYVGDGLPDGAHGEALARTHAALDALESAGHPVIRLGMSDATDIGAQFALWEIATATAGAVLGIDAFDQPNVQESKDNTKRILEEYASSGKMSEASPAVRTPNVDVVPLAGSRGEALGDDLPSALAAIFAAVRPGDYVAITAYIEMSAAHAAALQAVRLKIRDTLKVATTIGFGPRFLHSTGQLHKGGPDTCVVLQLTADPAVDLPIPGMTTFKTLLRAQALGDFESLDSRNRRGARLHLIGGVDAGIAAFADAVERASAARV